MTTPAEQQQCLEHLELKSPEPESLEELIDAIGDVIAFWGFKKNHGRIWAALFLSGRPQSSTELQKKLQLSKGAVSMLLSDLEEWSIVQRDPELERQRYYRANEQLLSMISNVLQTREAALLNRVLTLLGSAMQPSSSNQAADGLQSRLQVLKDFTLLASLFTSVLGQLQNRSPNELLSTLSILTGHSTLPTQPS